MTFLINFVLVSKNLPKKAYSVYFTYSVLKADK